MTIAVGTGNSFDSIAQFVDHQGNLHFFVNTVDIDMTLTVRSEKTLLESMFGIATCMCRET